MNIITHAFLTASAHTGEHGVDEYPDISGITTARVSDILVATLKFVLKKFCICLCICWHLYFLIQFL